METKQLEQFLVKLYNLCTITQKTYVLEYSLPYIACNDGTVLSIQCKSGTYSTTIPPRNLHSNADKFEPITGILSVEIMLNKGKDTTLPWNDEGIASRVTLDELTDTINKHGDFKSLVLNHPFWVTFPNIKRIRYLNTYFKNR